MLTRVESEWVDCRDVISSEIRELTQMEQLKLEKAASVSGGSRRSGKSHTERSVGSQQIIDSEREEAALLARLAFVEHSQTLKLQQTAQKIKLERMKIEHEGNLEKLQIQRELAEAKAKFNVSLKEEFPDCGLVRGEQAASHFKPTSQGCSTCVWWRPTSVPFME